MINAGIAGSMDIGQMSVEIEAEALTTKIERERKEDASNVEGADMFNAIVEGVEVVVQVTRGLLNQVNHLQNQVGIEEKVGNTIINLQEDTGEDDQARVVEVHQDLIQSIHTHVEIERPEVEVEAERTVVAAVRIQEHRQKIRK
jgi:hypothetical protein